MGRDIFKSEDLKSTIWLCSSWLSPNKLKCTTVKPGVRSKHKVKMMTSGDLEDSKTTQCNSSWPTTDLRAHEILQITFQKMDTLCSKYPHTFLLLKSLFSLKRQNKNTTDHFLGGLFLYGPTLSSSLQVHLRLQCQVLHKRIWAAGPKKGSIFWCSEEQTPSTSCLRHLVITYNGHSTGWEEVQQGDTESIQF